MEHTKDKPQKKSKHLCENPLHNIQVEADGRCHWCESKEPYKGKVDQL